jgi:hypothetical protein
MTVFPWFGRELWNLFGPSRGQFLFRLLAIKKFQRAAGFILRYATSFVTKVLRG